MDETEFKGALKDKGITMSRVANCLGVDKASVTRWAQNRVPAERVLEFERITGVSRHDLRPDLYPRDEAAA